MSAPAVTRGLVAVTGATGFLGQHLVRALAEEGWRIRLLVRRDPVSAFWKDITPEIVFGDLSDPVALARLCAGADVVVHNAGLIAGSDEDFRKVNVEATARLATFVAGHMVLVSSLAARAPELSPYAASKRAGETAALKALGPERLTVARPPAIYGPGDRETLRLFHAALKSPILPVLNPSARVAVVHVRDAARQIAALVGARAPGVFALSDGRPEGYSWKQLMMAAAEACGRHPPVMRLPHCALYAMAWADGLARHWRKGPPLLTFGKVNELTFLDWGIPTSEQAAQKPAPEFDLLPGFRHTIDWYRSHGWL
ncbi:NAD-dependent epimerase/dehydratase family protein [Phenylobacterium immobile]|uniref:NAD-dependent epimerase/dehydratase family protein n=1 Tax=Phenylobacterium immobile TaxID=21 RepID=UPI000A9D3AB7|nr:SDR family NAD(P)-dependent oxidoreductase [Phenylobacterium immobile]